MQTVIVQNVLSKPTWFVHVFNGRDEKGQVRRFAVRPEAMARPPVSGEAWRIAGMVRRHPKYGLQVDVESATLVRTSGRLVIDLLSGPKFHGIGPATARALWDHLGERLYQVLADRDVGALIEALGDTARGRAQAATLVEEWPTVHAEPEVLAWLERHGFTPRLAEKVLGCYGPDADGKLEADPYRLLAFGSRKAGMGVTWAKVDQLARSMGVGLDDERRLAAACEQALYARLDDAHTWTGTEVLSKAVGRLLGDPGASRTAIETAAEDHVIVPVAGGWQPLGPHAMERFVADRITLLLTGADGKASQPQLFHRPFEDLLAARALEAWQIAAGMTLNARQIEAVAMALTSPVSLLLGSAGVGKTTVLRVICDFADRLGIEMHLMALSGRAALRITEATGRPSRTIEGWLRRASDGSLSLNDEPLIVIDEASMVDLTSLYRIFRVAPPSCRFLMVGDPGQLPPVGFGVTLHAFAASDLIPRVELADVMRQAAETGIPAAAAAVRRGEMPAFLRFDPERDVGVSFVDCPRDRIVDTVEEIRASLTGHPAQIIGSVKGRTLRQDGGIRAINTSIHAAYGAGREILVGGYFVGEPVIWTVNDADLGIWNGSLGTVVGHGIEAIDGEEGPDGVAYLTVRFDDGPQNLPFQRLDDLELAWAITTHKAQGSAFDTVIVPVARSRLLDRRLLYTAITRAKRRVVLVGDRAAFEAAVATDDDDHARSRFSHRDTGLAYALSAHEDAFA